MRYAGQGWEIPVPLPSADSSPATRELITAALREGLRRASSAGAIEGLDIEIVSWSVKASSPLPDADRRSSRSARRARCSRRRGAELFDAASRAFVEAGVHERSGLTAGDRVEGPAIIVERETATIVGSSLRRRPCSGDGCLRVERRAG